MIKYLKYIILLILLSCNVTKPPDNRPPVYVPHVATWVTKNETFVLNYKLQKSLNNRDWITIIPINPLHSKDSSVYTYALAKTSIGYYYRVVANCTKGAFNTVSFFLPNTQQ